MLYIGTAGYSYDDWKGVFYPEKISDKELLPFYAGEFNFTEVNSTYYKMPNRFMLYNMQAKTPDGFQFVIKAHRDLTHSRENNRERFLELKEALKPLIEAGKLGCVLAQFPTSFRNIEENREYIKYFREMTEDIPVVIEFRHKEWIEGSTFGLLQDNGLGYVCVDEPQFKTLPTPEARATSAIGYVRFHGRNYKNWWRYGETYERYDYLYTKEELTEWVPKILELATETKKTFVSMNNHYRAQAAINGRMLRELIQNGGFTQ